MPRSTTNRRKLLVDQVQQIPGANLRQLQRMTDLPLSSAYRMLEDLEAEGVVRSESVRGYRRYFPTKGLHKRERLLLGVISKPRPRAILETVLSNPGIRHSELAEAVDLPAPTLTYYMKQIVGEDLIVVRKAGVSRHYRVKNPDLVRKSIKRTARGFDPKLA